MIALALVGALAVGLGGDDRAPAGPGTTASPDQTSAESPLGAAVDRVLARRWPEGAGGTVLVASGDEATCRGFGLADRESDVRAGCDTVYDLMSMTKQFTAVAVLRLAQEGELSLDDRLGRFFDDVPADKRSISVRHLLAHDSGLPESLGDDYDPLTRDQLIRRALGAPLVAEPGEGFGYSNVGYSLLAAVIEEVSGRSYEEYLSTALFGPAGMTSTGYVLPAWPREQIAVEYDARGRPQGRPDEHPWLDDGPSWHLRGNGGMLSTADDVLRWHRALVAGDLLDDELLDELFEAREPLGIPGFEDFHAAYGWTVGPFEGGRLATHSGGNDWSYGVLALTLADDGLVFWISNTGARRGDWNLAEDAQGLTLALVGALR